MNDPLAETTPERAMSRSLKHPDLLLTADESTELQIERIRHRLFRESLRSDDSETELLATILSEIEQITVVGPSPPSTLTVKLFAGLCGSQPLSVEQLRTFLESVAWAVNVSIQNKLDRWRESKTSDDGTTANVPGNQLESLDLHAEKTSPAGINLLTVQISPEMVDRKFSILKQLRETDQHGARWFDLWEFTGATPAEIARYYSRTEKEVTNGLTTWLSFFRDVRTSATGM